MKKLFDNPKLQESGQIVVLLAVSLVVLLIVAALAVDGGMVYTERRFAQNAADSSSLSAASVVGNYLVKNDIDYTDFSCSSLISGGEFMGVNEAKIRAVSNNVTDLEYQGVEYNGTWYPYNSGDINAKHGIIFYCEDRDNHDGILHDKHIDAKVRITTETSTAFLHLIFPDNLTSTVEAVTRLLPTHTVAYGTAILADKNEEDCVPSDKCGITFTGTSGTVVQGGGVHSDSTISASGTTSVDVTGTVTSYDPVIDGIDNITSSGTYGGQPYYENIVIDYPTCPAVDPTNKSITVNNGDTVTANPGSYEKITVNGGNLFLNPGLYCITKSQGISITGGITRGDQVTLYMVEGAVTINVTGDPTETYVWLTAPDVDDELGGWLILVDPANSSAVDITGSGGSYYAGAIFSPDGLVKIAGGSDPSTPDGQDYSTQIIAKSIEIAGNASVNINFDTSKFPQTPSKLNLLK